MLGLELTPELQRLEFHELAALLYRDNLRVKHSDRSRLAAELSAKKREEEMIEDKMLHEATLGAAHERNTNPTVELCIEHLLAAARPDAFLNETGSGSGKQTWPVLLDRIRFCIGFELLCFGCVWFLGTGLGGELLC